ncbi:MAG: hypothetical protein AB1521_02900 [Bacteroidota bacterium]
MEIKGISNNGFSQNPNKVGKPESNASNKPKDRIEISTEAREIVKADLGSQRLEEIKQKMQNKFYDSDEVINKVAAAIIKEFNDN